MTAYRIVSSGAFSTLLHVTAAHSQPKHSAPVSDATLEKCERQMIEADAFGPQPPPPNEAARLYACEHGVTLDEADKALARDEAIEKKAVMDGLDARDRMCNSPDYICGTITIDH